MIGTPRLLLRPIREDDVEALLGVFGDAMVKAAFGSEPFERAQMERWVLSNLEHQEQYGYGLFSVILRESGLLIGDCGFEWMELDGEAQVEFGYDFCSDYWGRGLATEAAAAARAYAFLELGLPGLVSVIRHGNHASFRMAEKIGMRLQKEIERYGQGYWLYGLSREDTEE
jgi:[ribosomal protein S5]-alanine N-acetyltransferase